jgi:hypothetical protein
MQTLTEKTMKIDLGIGDTIFKFSKFLQSFAKKDQTLQELLPPKKFNTVVPEGKLSFNETSKAIAKELDKKILDGKFSNYKGRNFEENKVIETK